MNGPRSRTPFSFLSAMQRLSLYNSTGGDGGGGGGGAPPIEIPKDLDPKVVEYIGTQAIDKFKGTLPKVPEKYEGLKVPEKSMLPATVLERTTAMARELGLTDATHAQRLVDFTNTETQQVIDAVLASHRPGGAAYKAQLKEWENAALTAPDLGGGKSEVLQAKVARVTAFTNKHFPEGLRTLLTEYGLGSHPEFFRAMLKIADLSKEDSLEGGDSGKSGNKSHADRIYGKEDK
jgi:hypothetical protein